MKTYSTKIKIFNNNNNNNNNKNLIVLYKVLRYLSRIENKLINI